MRTKSIPAEETTFTLDGAYLKREALRALRTYVEPVVWLSRFVAGAPIGGADRRRY